MRVCIKDRLPSPSNAFSAAFTRLELVVVMVVLGFLIGLHVAATPHGKSQTEAAVCLSNLRRLGLAWLMYAADHGGALPGNFDGGGGASNTTWCLGWLAFNNSFDNTNLDSLMTAQLGKYSQTPTIYHCPSDRSRSAGLTGPPRVRSISMNAYVGNPVSPGGPYTTGYRNFKMLDDFGDPSPAHAFVFVDEREDSINDSTLQVDMGSYSPRTPAADNIVDYPADWHDRGASLSFADGHVEIWHWQDPRTTPVHTPGMLIPLNVASPKNLDVERLQEAASRPVHP